MVIVDGELKKFRCIRRVPAADARRWNQEALAKVTVVPWVQSGSLSKPLVPETAGQARRYVPVANVGRDFPAMPDCTACAKRGQFAAGYHHSQRCRARREEWAHSEEARMTKKARVQPT